MVRTMLSRSVLTRVGLGLLVASAVLMGFSSENAREPYRPHTVAPVSLPTKSIATIVAEVSEGYDTDGGALLWVASRQALRRCVNFPYFMRLARRAAPSSRFILATDSLDEQLEDVLRRNRTAAEVTNSEVAAALPDSLLVVVAVRGDSIIDEPMYIGAQSSFRLADSISAHIRTLAGTSVIGK